MQFSKVALAIASLCAASAASAQIAPERIMLSAGASAVRGNLVAAVQSLCKSPNVASTFGSSNHFTVVCADAAVTSAGYATKPDSQFRNFDGLPFAEFRLNTSEGSFSSVLILNGTAYTFRDPGTNTNILPPAGAVVIGGFSDVETTRFPEAVLTGKNLFENKASGVAQAFGVAASNALYTKMFDAQKAAGVIPGTCNVNDTTLSYCIPSISKAQMATIMTDNTFNAAYVKGLGFLTGNSADDGVELSYVRRVDTSGTQASAQNYFLGLPCSLSPVAVTPQPELIAPATSSSEVRGAIKVYATGGTADVLAALNTDVYALGVASGENNQTGQSWRWLRVQGVAIGENAIPGIGTTTNRTTMLNGTYDFFYELTHTGNLAVLDVIADALNTLPAPRGLINKAQLDAGTNKGGLTCSSAVSN